MVSTQIACRSRCVAEEFGQRIQGRRAKSTGRGKGFSNLSTFGALNESETTQPRSGTAFDVRLDDRIGRAGRCSGALSGFAPERRWTDGGRFGIDRRISPEYGPVALSRLMRCRPAAQRGPKGGRERDQNKRGGREYRPAADRIDPPPETRSAGRVLAPASPRRARI